MSYGEGKLCKYYENGQGSCFRNGSRCDNPFCEEGCKIQSVRIFKEKYGDLNFYEPTDGESETYTKVEAQKYVGIKKGMMIADWFMPYEEVSDDCPSDAIDFCYSQVRNKFEKEGYIRPWMTMLQNVEMFGMKGMYFIGILQRGMY